MRIAGIGARAFYRYFGVFNYAMFGNERRAMDDRNSTDLAPFNDAFISYIKR